MEAPSKPSVTRDRPRSLEDAASAMRGRRQTKQSVSLDRDYCFICRALSVPRPACTFTQCHNPILVKGSLSIQERNSDSGGETAVKSLSTDSGKDSNRTMGSQLLAACSNIIENTEDIEANQYTETQPQNLYLY